MLISSSVVGPSAAAARTAETSAAPADAARLLVRFRAAASAAEKQAVVRSIGASLDGGIPVLGVTRLALAGGDAAAAVAALRASAAVESVERDGIAAATFAPNDPYYPSDPILRLGQWGLRKAHVDKAWDVVRAGPSLTVAVIDTGVDPRHPDLRDALLPARTFVSALDVACTGTAWDDNGHGTATAGVIAASGDNWVGIAGVAYGVRVLPLKALDCHGYGLLSDVARAIVYAVDRGAKIVQLSLGTPVDSEVVHAAIRYAAAHDVLVFAAAGNCGLPSARCLDVDEVSYPAAYPEVVAVAATDENDAHAPFSSQAPYVAVAAPGRVIFTTLPTYKNKIGGTDYGFVSGTSLAVPFAAGVAALVWQRAPSLTAAQVREILTASADDLGVPGQDPEFGAGRVNAERAVELARGARAAAVSGFGVAYDVAAVPALLPGAATLVTVTARNTGSETWQAEGPGRVQLAAHLSDAFGRPVLWEGERAALAADVPPGGSAIAQVALAAPLAPGAYRASFDLVREDAGWASAAGIATADAVLVVAPDFRASMSAGPLAVSRASPAATVTIANTSGVAWTPRGEIPVTVSSHWLDAGGRVLVWDGPRAELPRTVRPGESVTMIVPLGTIPDGGARVVIDLVAEGWRWFGAGIARPVTVTP